MSQQQVPFTNPDRFTRTVDYSLLLMNTYQHLVRFLSQLLISLSIQPTALDPSFTWLGNLRCLMNE